jgi:hypothetical protein
MCGLDAGCLQILREESLFVGSHDGFVVVLPLCSEANLYLGSALQCSVQKLCGVAIFVF